MKFSHLPCAVVYVQCRWRYFQQNQPHDLSHLDREKEDFNATTGGCSGATSTAATPGVPFHPPSHQGKIALVQP